MWGPFNELTFYTKNIGDFVQDDLGNVKHLKTILRSFKENSPGGVYGYRLKNVQS